MTSCSCRGVVRPIAGDEDGWVRGRDSRRRRRVGRRALASGARSPWLQPRRHRRADPCADPPSQGDRGRRLRSAAGRALQRRLRQGLRRCRWAQSRRDRPRVPRRKGRLRDRCRPSLCQRRHQPLGRRRSGPHHPDPGDHRRSCLWALEERHFRRFSQVATPAVAPPAAPEATPPANTAAAETSTTSSEDNASQASNESSSQTKSSSDEDANKSDKRKKSESSDENGSAATSDKGATSTTGSSETRDSDKPAGALTRQLNLNAQKAASPVPPPVGTTPPAAAPPVITPPPPPPAAAPAAPATTP